MKTSPRIPLTRSLFNPQVSRRSAAALLAGVAGLLALGAPDAFAQSNPTAQSLPFSQDFSALAATSTTYPAGFQGWDISTVPGSAFNTTGPTADRALTASGGASLTSGAVYNYNGKIGFLNTGSLDESLALAVVTTGLSSIQVQYDVMTIRNPYDGGSNTRTNEVTLQYRVGTSGAWTSLTGIEYRNINVTQTGVGVTTPQNVQTKTIILPPACDNQPVVQLRWASRQVSGGGSRPSFAFDNISVAQVVSVPTITTQPASRTNFAGTAASFTVQANGTAPFTYQWYKDNLSSPVSNGGQISGATSNVLSIANVSLANDADYLVIVSNGAGSATSSPPAHLTVTNQEPTFVVQPQDRTVLLGTVAGFSASVVGAIPLSYQWQSNGVDIADGPQFSGSGTSSLTISNAGMNLSGVTFQVVVTNAFGTNTSSVAALTVATSGVLAGWDFNGIINTTNPVTSQGSIVAVASPANALSFSNNTASGNDFGTVTPNNAWGSDTYPALGVSNKQAGLQFKVGTVGLRNITVDYETRGTPTASRFQRLQYTTNGTDFIDYPFSSSLIAASSYQPRSFNLTGFPGVRNNPNFGIRIVTEFESTASYGATNNAQYVGISSGYSSVGTLSYDILNISAEVTNASTPPTISSTTNFVIQDSAPYNTNFTIGDAETPVGSLSVSAVSGNHSILSDPGIINNGDGTATLTLSPSPNVDGIVPIIVRVTDSDGDVATTWFNVTVVPGNQPPVLSGLFATNMLTNATLTIPITIGDDNTPAGSLTLDKLSGNQTLLPTANISFGGSGSNRTVVITPVAGQAGVAPITISVNDGEKTTAANFTLLVRPNTAILFNESFDYDTAGAITARSFGLWQSHSSSGNGAIQVGSGVVTVTGSAAEDINAPLLGQPYPSNSTAVLYSSFKVNFSAAPDSGGNYFAHFKDNTTFGFFARVYASTLNAAPGSYRLGIGNSSGVTNTTAQLPQDLLLNSNYTVVTRLVLPSGTCTLWVDPTSESSDGVTDSSTVTNLADIYSYAFRQSPGEGTVAVDDLKVGLSFSAVTGIASFATPPHPSITGISIIGGNVVINGTNNSGNTPNFYRVLTSTNVASPLSNWTALGTNAFNANGSLNYTNATGGAQQFYILQVSTNGTSTGF
jgi:hypothetical protein